jgi:hypothetical protein
MTARADSDAGSQFNAEGFHRPLVTINAILCDLNTAIFVNACGNSVPLVIRELLPRKDCALDLNSFCLSNLGHAVLRS